jgi:peroxin-19
MADKEPQQVANAPDPDEDDLDDLDDVLDSFQATSVSSPAPANTTSPSAPTASGPGRPPTTASKDASMPVVEEAFAKQLQAGMADLMSELDSNPSMQAEFEKMMQELIGAGAAGSDPEAAAHPNKAAEAASVPAEPAASKPTAASASSSSAKKDTPEDFQSTIRRTMERISASDSTAKASTASAAGPQSEEDLLAQMMKELTEGGMGGGGEDGDFNTMLMNMMAHLTNKEILYEPMKELHDNFPAWMEKNSEREKKEDLDRYKEQQKLVGEIVKRFERKGYSDDNEDDREYIVERMQKVRLADRD